MSSKKKGFILVVLAMTFVSMSSHKFYVGIFQINQNVKKKTLEITTRVFVDDLNLALKKNYDKTTYIGEQNESKEEIEFLKKYFSQKFQIKVNGKKKELKFWGKELENNVLICYFSCQDVNNISSIEVDNAILVELFPEQQNIIQANFNNKKQNLLLTSERVNGILK